MTARESHRWTEQKHTEHWVFVFHCCIAKDHKLSGLSSQFLWVEASRHSLAGSSAQGLSQAVTKALARLGSQLKAGLGKGRLPSSRSCWQDSAPQFLTGHSLEHPSVPSSVGFSDLHTRFIKAGKPRRQ